MSEFLTAETAIQASHRDCFIKALEEVMPDWKGQIEVYEGQGELLMTYLARDQRGQRANIVIRRKHVGSASNDIGFRVNEKGTYDAIISDYDRGHSGNGRYGRQWMDNLTKNYSWQIAQQQAEELNMDLERTVNEDGSWRVE